MLNKKFEQRSESLRQTMANRTIFITGVTGALGPWLAQRALQNGCSVRALTRAEHGVSAVERAKRSLGHVSGQQELSGLEVVDGDFAEGEFDCGDVAKIIHCAACTSFREGPSADSVRSNVDGLRRILDAASRRRTPVVHVSTAYTCGDRADRVDEDELPLGPRFNNVYERTKAQGEALVREWSQQTGIPATILRPSIALGAWSDGRAARFSTIYLLMKTLDAAGKKLAGQRVRLIGNPEVTKNVIPVDWFADVAWRIAERDDPGATYHITHSQPISLAGLAEILGRLFECRIDLVRPDQFDQRRGTPIERLCGQMMAPYRPYMMQAEPIFGDRRVCEAVSSVQAPRIDLDYFKRLLAYGRKVQWQRAVDLKTVDPPARKDVRGYFDEFLALRMHRNLLPDLRNLSARFCISMKDLPGAQWTLVVENGVLTEVTPGENAVQSSFALDSQTFLRIVGGQLPPQRAFFLGRIRIRGNIEMGLKVATVLSKFFVAYPYLAETA